MACAALCRPQWHLISHSASNFLLSRPHSRGLVAFAIATMTFLTEPVAMLSLYLELRARASSSRVNKPQQHRKAGSPRRYIVALARWLGLAHKSGWACRMGGREREGRARTTIVSACWQARRDTACMSLLALAAVDAFNFCNERHPLPGRRRLSVGHCCIRRGSDTLLGSCKIDFTGVFLVQSVVPFTYAEARRSMSHAFRVLTVPQIRSSVALQDRCTRIRR